MGLVAAWWISVRVDDRMEDQFSEFWQKHQRNLRLALKQVATEAQQSGQVTSSDTLRNDLISIVR
jgi:hypothetical protein